MVKIITVDGVREMDLKDWEPGLNGTWTLGRVEEYGKLGELEEILAYNMPEGVEDYKLVEWLEYCADDVFEMLGMPTAETLAAEGLDTSAEEIAAAA